MPVTSSSSSSVPLSLHSSPLFLLQLRGKVLFCSFFFNIWRSASTFCFQCLEKQFGQLMSVFQKSETRRERGGERAELEQVERQRQNGVNSLWQTIGRPRAVVSSHFASTERQRERESRREKEVDREWERVVELENGMEKWFISLYRSFDRSIGAICGSLFRRLITKIKSFSQITDYLLHLPARCLRCWILRRVVCVCVKPRRIEFSRIESITKRSQFHYCIILIHSYRSIKCDL